MKLNRNLNHGLWNLVNVWEKYGSLSIVLPCLCKHDELNSSFRHNSDLSGPYPQSWETSKNIYPGASIFTWAPLPVFPGMSAGWLEAVVCYSHLCLSTGIWQREVDFILVNSPPGGRSVPIWDAVVVGLSKLELNLRVWLYSELGISLFFLYTEQIWCDMAEKRSSINPLALLFRAETRSTKENSEGRKTLLSLLSFPLSYV